MKEDMWYEDMFTPEGVLMKAPTDAGMKGSQNWRYDREQYRYDNKKEENKTATPGYR